MEENILKKIGDGIVDVAPTIGALLTGTVVGAPAGAAVNALGALGRAFGLGTSTTPAAVATAILSDPEARLKVIMAENQYNIDVLKEETAQLQAVNATMQAESRSEYWPQYSWRPFWGFASGTAFIVVCILVCIMAWEAVSKNNALALGNIPLIVGAFSTLFAIPGAILGIASWKRGQMQIAQNEGSCK